MPCNGRFGSFHYVCETYAGCDPGRYGSSGTSGTCHACPKGRYRAQAGGTAVSSCPLCPGGRYGSSTALTSESCTGACAQGHYCPSGSTSSNANACPAGTYGQSGVTNLASSACSGPCSPGYYCTGGSTTPTPSSKKCKAGRYGNGGNVNNDCTGECSAGYYCNTGSGSPTQHACGGSNKYCPKGSSSATTVSSGYYSTGGSGTTTRTSQVKCEKGHYCVSGVKHSCPAGRYGATEGLTSSSCSGLCDAGFFCPAGSISKTQENCGTGSDPAKYYCGRGVTARATASGSQYTTPEDAPATQRTGVATCPSNFVCSSGERKERVEWSDTYATCSTGAATMFVDENAASATVGRVNAVSNLSPALSISYSRSYVLLPSSCGSNPVSISSSGVITVGSTPLDKESCSGFTIRVTAQDTSSNSITCDVSVEVNDLNDRPQFINTSPSLTIEEGAKLHALVGSAVIATDPDVGQELLYEITGGNGAGWFKISRCSGQITMARADIDFETNSAPFTLSLRVVDDGTPTLDHTATATIQVVNVNDPPRWALAPASHDFVAGENGALGLALVGAQTGVLADDPDGDALTYTITRNDGDAFAIDSATGVITIAAPGVLNYEARDLYIIAVTVSDPAGLSITSDFEIVIANANDAPVVAGLDLELEELYTGMFGAPASATDDDVGTVITWSITSVSPASSAFSIGSSSGQLSVTSALNFETVPQYTIVLRATDDGMTGVGGDATPTFTERTFTIDVLDVNEPPIYASPQSFNIDEDADLGDAVAGGALVFTDADDQVTARQEHFFTTTDGDQTAFVVDAAGQIVTADTLDFETKSSYTLTIRLADNGAPSLDDTITVPITVNNVNEPPSVPSQTVTLAENSGAGVALSAIISGDDPDLDTDARDLTYFLTGGGLRSDAFAIATDGTLSSASPLPAGFSFDFEDTSDYSLEIRVQDPQGLEGTGFIQISILDVNEHPTIGAQEFALQEQSPAGTEIGLVVAADQDVGDLATLVFTISGGNADGTMALSATGQLTVAPGKTAPSFVESPRVVLTADVTVADHEGLDATASISVQIVDTNFPPTISDKTLDVREDVIGGTVIIADLEATAGAGDDDILKYFLESSSLPEGSEAQFAIDQDSGVITLDAPFLDYESQDFYELHVMVQDDGAGGTQPLAQARATVTLNVLDVPESPRVAPAEFTVFEQASVSDVVGSLTVSDEDTGDSVTLAVTYDQVNGQTGAVPFDLTDAGLLTVSAPLDFESRPVHHLNVTATDTFGLQTWATLTINIENANDPPVLTTVNADLSEDADVSTEVAVMSATDPDAGTVFSWAITGGNEEGRFAITADGVVVLVAPVDWENDVEYVLNITVWDSGVSPILADWDMATISILNVNDIVLSPSNDLSGALVAATNGGETVTLTASNLGPTATRGGSATVAATYSRPATSDEEAAGMGTTITYTATGCTVSVPNTEVECQTVAGTGAGFEWTFQVTSPGVGGGPDAVTAVTTTSYAVPVITAVTGAAGMSTSGGDVVSITGSHFGPVGTPVRAYYGPSPSGGVYEASSCAVSVAHSEIQCQSVPGVGAGLTFTVTVADQPSDGFGDPAFAYTPPAIGTAAGDLFGATVLRSQGGETVSFSGTNFGPDGTTVTATYGVDGTRYAAASCTLVAAHSRVDCTSAPGTGAGHVWQLTVGGQTSVPSAQTTRYDTPYITSVEGTGARRASTAGNEQVLITGNHFGPPGETVPMAVYGGETATGYIAVNCVVRGHELIECRSAEGTGFGHAWAVTVDGQTSPVFAAESSYHPPIIASFDLQSPGVVDAVTQGGEVVRIFGSNFGTTTLGTLELVTYGVNGTEFTAVGCVVSEPHIELRCFTAQGVGAELQWIVWVDRQQSVAPTTEYGQPSVTSITGEPAGGFHTDGGQEVRLHGVNFGEPGQPYLEAVRYGPSGKEYPVTNCNVLSHFEIRCFTVAGTGQGLVTFVRVGAQDSTELTTPPTLSYATPVVERVMPNGSDPAAGEAKVLIPTTGGTVVTLSGLNYGLRDSRSAVTVYYRGVPLPSTSAPTLNSWHADVVSETDVEVSAADAAAHSPTSTPSVGADDGVWTWTNTSVVGGPDPDPFYVRTTVSRVVHSAEFVLPRGEGSDQQLFVRIGAAGEEVDSPVVTLSYESPELYDVVATKGETPTELVLELQGLYFGQYPTVTVWDFDETEVLVAYKVNADTDPWVTDVPAVVASTPGGPTLTCEFAVDDSRLRCVYAGAATGPTGARRGTIIVSDNTGRTSSPKQFEDIAPQISSLLADALTGQELFGTNGTTRLSLEGESFGTRTRVQVDAKWCVNPPEYSLVCSDCVAFNEEADCPVCDASNPNATVRQYLYPLPAEASSVALAGGHRVECIAGVGYGDVNVLVRSDTQASTPVSVKYRKPVVTGLSLSSWRTAGTVAPGSSTRQTLTITGSNFGDWDQVEADCANDTRVSSPTFCDASAMCRQIPTGSGGAAECHAVCRSGDPTCGWDARPVHPLGRVSLARPSSGAGSNLNRTFLRVTEWTHDRIVGELPEGEGAGWVVEVEVGLPTQMPLEDGIELAWSGEFPKSLEAPSFDFEAPTVSGVTVLSGPFPGTAIGGTAGGDTIEVTGDNFGVASPDPLNILQGAKVDVCDASGGLCLPCAKTSQTHERITCVTPSGIGSDKWVRVMVAGQANTNTAPARFAYGVPALSTMSHTAVTTGSMTVVTVTGTNFGSPTELARYGASGADLLAVAVTGLDLADPGARATTVTAHTHTSISFIVPEGEGADNTVSVTVAGQASNTLDLAYLPPVISSIVPADPTECCGTKGGYDLVITGDSLGRHRSNPSPLDLSTMPGFRFDYDKRRRVLFSVYHQRSVTTLDDDGIYPRDWRECVESTDGLPLAGRWSHNGIVCSVPDGIGRNLSVVVVTGYSSPQVSNAFTWNYDPPEITGMTPNPADAEGSRDLKFFGRNFADLSNTILSGTLSLEIGGLACEEVVDVPAEPAGSLVVSGNRALQCRSQRHEVGVKNVTFFVAEQAGYLTDDLSTGPLFYYSAYCTGSTYDQYDFDDAVQASLDAGESAPQSIARALVHTTSGAGKYGRPGEFCADCPAGAVCIGYFDRLNEPMAAPGWWNDPVNTTRVDPDTGEVTVAAECPPEHVDSRDQCHNFIGCLPDDSCLGNNVCSEKYTGDRCADCTEGNYRSGGECIPCPSNVWILVVGFVLLATAACVFGYVMNRKGLHFAFISIGADYLQVLAVFASSNYEWPSEIEALLNAFRLASFDLNITAPECAIPALSFELKWFAFMALPVAATVIFWILHVMLWVRKRCIMGQKQNANSHLDGIVGMTLIMMYYLYLIEVRMIFEVFNCAPLEGDKDDGHEYLAVKFERCGKPGGTQLTLMPFAIIFLVVYALGFPALLGFIFFKKYKLMVEDQVLRAFGLGARKMDNPNAYKLRRRYSKLYYHFKPSLVWWKLMILGRKFMVAFTALMFRQNLTFQLSSILLVLIISYGLQVKWQPYMSPAKFEEEVSNHHTLQKEGHPLHTQIKNTIAPVLMSNHKHAAKSVKTWSADKLSFASLTAHVVDYNTVESVLLYCAILICIAGIMFESGQLDSRTFEAQRQFVTYAVLLIIIFSLLYFVGVLIHEVVSTCCPDKLRAFTHKKKGDDARRLDRDSAKEARNRRKSYLSAGKEVQLATNPMLMRRTGGVEGDFDSLLSGTAQVTANTPREVLMKLVTAQKDQISDMREQAAALKRHAALRSVGSSNRRNNGRAATRKNKTRFAGTKARGSGGSSGLAADAAASPPGSMGEEAESKV